MGVRSSTAANSWFNTVSALRLRASKARLASKMDCQLAAGCNRRVIAEQSNRHRLGTSRGLRQLAPFHGGDLRRIEHRQFVRPAARALNFQSKHVGASRPRLREYSQPGAAAAKLRESRSVTHGKITAQLDVQGARSAIGLEARQKMLIAAVHL